MQTFHLRTKQLDRQLATIRELLPIQPATGWLRTIREGLGMGLRTFARRMGIAASTASQLEHAEVSGSITINRLKAAADVLGCDVRVILVPREPLSKQLKSRALVVAEDRVQRLAHTMSLEGQGLSRDRIDEMKEETAEKLLESGGSALWE